MHFFTIFLWYNGNIEKSLHEAHNFSQSKPAALPHGGSEKSSVTIDGTGKVWYNDNAFLIGEKHMAFRENEHPRDGDGKFTDKEGGAKSKTEKLRGAVNIYSDNPIKDIRHRQNASYEDILNPYIYRRGRRQGEQIICSVVFHEKGEKHPYLTEDEHLEVGDKVLVQAGPYKQELPGKIVSIDYYRKEDLPEELGDIGEILKKIEE